MVKHGQDFYCLAGESWRRQWHPTPALLPGKSHGQRSLVGCRPWCHEESDRTERLHFHFSLSCIGEWNGNPLQCSCLENPRDGGAWWAAIYGVAQSQTRLTQLSSSTSWRREEAIHLKKQKQWEAKYHIGGWCDSRDWCPLPCKFHWASNQFPSQRVDIVWVKWKC